MKVWVDQAKCLGSGQCEETAPAVFTVTDDNVAYVRQDGEVLDEPGGESSQAVVPEDAEDDTELAARECPAQCIHIVG